MGMDILSNVKNNKYINRYIEKESCYELHITDLKNIDIFVLIDKEDFIKCSSRFICMSLTGREGYRNYTIYYYENRKKYPLNRLLLNTEQNKKIIYKNKNCLDFRKNNLSITGKHESFIRDDSLKEIPTSIFKRERNGIIIGYVVYYFECEPPMAKATGF